MALGDPYAEVCQLEERLGRSDNGSFGPLLDAASRAVESFTRRQFNRLDEPYAIARRFRALDRERVAVDDFFTLEDLEVVVNGTAWDVETQIDPRPWNGTTQGQTGWPYADLFAINRSFPWSRRALVTVTAWWGWEAVPAAIMEATLDVAEVMSLGSRTVSQAGMIRSETIGGYSISYGLPNLLNGAGLAGVPVELHKAVPFRRKVFGVA
jgi:hypothetical protein